MILEYYDLKYIYFDKSFLTAISQSRNRIEMQVNPSIYSKKE